MADIKKYVSLDKLTKYDAKIKGLIDTKDNEVKAYADSLAKNYDAAGAAATVQGKLDEEVARAKAAEEANAAAAKQAQDEVDALELVVKGIQENAYDDTALRAEIEGEFAKKADKTQVATDIAAAVKVEEEARIAAVSGVQGAVDALSGTHATDKKNLEDAIALKADKTALDAVSAVANAAATAEALAAEVKRAGEEEARIEGLVSDEAERAAAAEEALEERLVEVETFFKTAEDETIDQAMDTLVEIQKYITEDGAAADQMVKDIAANKKAIEDHAATDHDFAAADEAIKSELEGKINLKAAQADLEALDGRVETAEGAIEDNAGAIAELQAKFGEGEGSVADMISDAVAAEAALRVAGDEAAEASAAAALAAAQAAQSAAEAADGKAVAAQGEVDALELVVDTKAAASDVTALAGRVTTAEGKITTLEGEMDAVEALAAANASAIEALQAASETHATQTALQAEIDRAVAKENAIEAKVDAFVEVSEEEINALFPTA